jgi:RNA polymerase sigma factor (sigma-70 family)
MSMNPADINPAEHTVFVVDDDAAVRDSLALLLGLRGYRTLVFASGEDFLATWRPDWSGCLVADIRMPGLSGLELQQRLAESGADLPVIIITAHGDAASARAALRADAVDFLEKPIDDAQLMAAIETGLARAARRRELEREKSAAAQRLARLTPREREVLELVTAGRHSREIGAALDISPRTVEVYKARLMEKLQAKNVTELIRLVLAGEAQDAARR